MEVATVKGVPLLEGSLYYENYTDFIKVSWTWKEIKLHIQKKEY